MNIEELKNLIGECDFLENKVCVKEKLHFVLKILAENYSYKILKSITAVDLGNEIELLYNIYSAENEEDAIISIKVQNQAESVVDLFESAIADENEIYDLFGIEFIGNKNLKRLYMPDNWEGFPLRKDYVQDDTRLAWNDNSDNT